MVTVTIRAAALALTALLLTGCTGCEREQAALREAREALAACQAGAADRAMAQQALAEALSRWLALAEACESPYLGLPCPTGIPSAEGLRARAAEALGGWVPAPDGLVLWGTLAARLAAALLPVTLALALGGWAWGRLARPAQAKAEEARRLVAEASTRAEEARQVAEAWERRARAAQAQAEAAEARAEEAEARVAQAQAEAQRLAEARRLLTGL